MAIELQKSPRETVSGPAFDALVKAFDDIMTKGKEDPVGLQELKFATQDLFTVEVQSIYFPVYGQVSSYKFYGFRVFPYPIDYDLNEGASGKIVIELDPRLVNDYSHHLNPNEVAMLFIYHITEIFPNVELNNRIRFLHKAYMTPDNIDWRIVHLYTAQNPTVYQLNNLLALYRYYWVNFKKAPVDSSIVSGWNDSMAIYSSAVNKLIKAYGTMELVDRKMEEFDRGALGIVKLIYESINDLKHSAFRFRKNLVNIIKTTNSPYGKKVLSDLYHSFSNKVDMVFAEESTQFIGHQNVDKKTKEMIAIENANIDAYWKKHMKTLLENVDVQFLDRNGMALKCSKLEVDELMVQVNDIDSTDDKIFLLEKVHRNLGIIDNALMMLKIPDKKHRVRQSETELKSLRSELELIRERIFKMPTGSTRYGLFIKYPEGYEG
jgi:hypothetical protein